MLNLITIGYAREALREQSREAVRMEAYARACTSMHVIIFTKRGDGYREPIVRGNLTLYPTNSRTRLHMLVDAVRIGRRILKASPNESWVVSSQDPFETSLVGLSIVWRTNARHHVQLHGDNFGNTGWRYESVLNQFRYCFGLVVLRHARAIRVVSERIKASLIARGVSEANITVLPIRPELESFLAAKRTRTEGEPFTFLFIGRLSPEKNIGRIIDAFAEVIKKYPTIQLRIVGKGNELRLLTDRVRMKSIVHAVHFDAWTEDVPTAMANADAFLLASLHEAYGLTLIEALAVGLPIVTTDVGCVGEVVHDGEHGIVVNEEGVQPYARALERMVTDAQFRSRCAQAGRETATALAAQSADVYVQAWVTALERTHEKV